ncbi:hypothetical protein BY458DRAFT_528833 [Sporodiniella umbellata]|nr:hypothetical protein BY458DRAFT_528833 [Sporodiniella umbellata]
MDLGELVGSKMGRNHREQGLLPTHLFRLKKRKLEAIFRYLDQHHLVHQAMNVKGLQTQQLAEYLLATIYPGYSPSRAKNFAYADYRECRENEEESVDPIAYDHVPTTEMFERLDEVYAVNVDWQDKEDIKEHTLYLPVSCLQKAINRVDFVNRHRPLENVAYHLYLWNSPRTLIKPQCRSLQFDTFEVWNQAAENTVQEGFMHIDLSDPIRASIRRKSMHSIHEPIGHPRHIRIRIELEDNNEQNISHISICAVLKKTSDQLVSQLYMQSTTDFIHKSIYSSPYPVITQQIMIQVLKQAGDAQTIFTHCLAGDLPTQEEPELDLAVIEPVSLKDPVHHQRLQHPVRTIHCKHRSCFDALLFFERHKNHKRWYCPICLVQIKHLEELKMDYLVQLALEDANKDIVYLIGDYLSQSARPLSTTTSYPPVAKKLRTLTHVS